jgi:hypothetical protein
MLLCTKLKLAVPLMGVDSSPPLLSAVFVALFRAIEYFYVACTN